MCDQCERHQLDESALTWSEAILGGLAVALVATIVVLVVAALLGVV